MLIFSFYITDYDEPLLVQHILYRQKEQFSDGVGYSWIDGLKAHAEQHVTLLAY